jgi:hypothetical protein
MAGSKRRRDGFLISGLLTSGDDELEAFRAKRIGRDSQVSIEHLRLVRSMLDALVQALHDDDEEQWARVRSSWSALSGQATLPGAMPSADGAVAGEAVDPPAPVGTALGARVAPVSIPLKPSPWSRPAAAASAAGTAAPPKPPASERSASERSASERSASERSASERSATPEGDAHELPAPALSSTQEGAVPRADAVLPFAGDDAGELRDRPDGLPRALPFDDQGRALPSPQLPGPQSSTAPLAAPAAAAPDAGAPDASAPDTAALDIDQYLLWRAYCEVRPGQSDAVLQGFGSGHRAAEVEQAWRRRLGGDPALRQLCSLLLPELCRWLATADADG